MQFVSALIVAVMSHKIAGRHHYWECFLFILYRQNASAVTRSCTRQKAI